MTLKTSQLSLVVLTSMMLLLVPSGRGATAQEEGEGFWAANGRVSFRLYCASCHGVDAKGNGNVAKYLKVQPADLTRIEERYGEWPEERLYEIIDGREEVRAHGRREMPVWGDVLMSPLSDTSPTEEEGEMRADRKIRELVIFLRSIQVAGE